MFVLTEVDVQLLLDLGNCHSSISIYNALNRTKAGFQNGTLLHMGGRRGVGGNRWKERCEAETPHAAQTLKTLEIFAS